MSELDLAQLLNGRRPSDFPVAMTGGRVLTLGRLRADVARNAAALRGARRVLLVCEDSYRFLTGLLALLHIGADIVLPPNAQSGTLRMIGDSFDLLVTDVSRADVARGFVIESTDAEAAPFMLEVERGRLDFFTSGSTGDMKRVEKTTRLLEREAQILETLWGGQLANAQVFATVSHQHIFGLTFKLLWPLLAGRCFCTETHGAWEALLAELSPGAVIVSSPAHLTRIGGLTPLPPSRRPRMILTAGAPLPPEAAAETQEILGTAPTEIFGSTETGAIAWRTVTTGPSFWQALPGIEIGSHGDGLLRVRSPLIGGDGWCDLADRIVIADDGRFRFEGRADRILKIEGKRVSLQQLEREMAALPWIEAAAVAPLAGPRSVLGAVAVLSAAGKGELARLGKFRFERLLRRSLANTQDGAALPRRWRFVEELPMDGMGKRRTADIAALLAEAPMSVTEPAIRDVRRFGGAVELSLSVPKTLLYLSGHFPGFAVLPGVVQLDWAIRYGRQYLGLGSAAAKTVQVKFRKPIRPDRPFDLRLDYSVGQRRLSFECRDEDGVYSSGQVVFDA